MSDINEMVEDLKKEIWGNGQPGLADRTIRIETMLERLCKDFYGLRKWFFGIAGSLIVMGIVALVGSVIGILVLAK